MNFWEELTARSNSVDSNAKPGQLGAGMLRHLHDGHLAGQIRWRRGPVAAKGRNTRREYNLALDRGHITALLWRLAESTFQGVLRACIEQLKESSHCEESGGNIEIEGIVHVFHREIGEQRLAQVRQRGCRVEPHGGSDAARVGNYKVNIAHFRLDSIYSCLKVFFGGHIGLVGDYNPRKFLGSFLENLQSTAQDVNLVGAVRSQSPGHGQANTCIGNHIKMLI